MNEITSKYFASTDIELTATLYALGHELVDLTELAPKRYEFVFKNTPDLMRKIGDYSEGTLLVSPQDLFDARRKLLHVSSRSRNRSRTF